MSSSHRNDRIAVNPIIDTLRRAREDQNLSQREVALLIGRSSYQSVWAWERGVNDPTLANLQTWAAALGYDITLNKR